MRSRLQLHLLLTAMICHLLHHRALGQQDEEATAAISCLVKRPGHGLVSELCPVDSRACRIKVRDDQSIEYYPFGRHYDRARLACVRASEMTVKRHSTDCHRLPSGAVRCWCGHRRDCNDEASALLLFRTFRDYGSKGVERLRQKWEQEAHNQLFGPIDLDVYSGDDESAPTSSTSTTTPTTTTTTTTTTSTPPTTTTLSTTITIPSTTVATTSKLPRVIYFGPNEEDDVGEDDDEGLDIANLEEDEETDARLADTLWTKMTDEARAAVKYVQEHDADKGANEEEEDDDGDDDDRGADKEGGRPVKVHIRPLVNKSLEKGGGNYVVEKATTTGAPPPSATTAKKRKKTTTTTTESAQKQWEDEEDDYEEEEMSDDDRRRDNDLSMFRPFAKRNHSPVVSCSIGVASMAFILAALERL